MSNRQAGPSTGAVLGKRNSPKEEKGRRCSEICSFYEQVVVIRAENQAKDAGGRSRENLEKQGTRKVRRYVVKKCGRIGTLSGLTHTQGKKYQRVSLRLRIPPNHNSRDEIKTVPCDGPRPAKAREAHAVSKRISGAFSFQKQKKPK